MPLYTNRSLQEGLSTQFQYYDLQNFLVEGNLWHKLEAKYTKDNHWATAFRIRYFQIESTKLLNFEYSNIICATAQMNVTFARANVFLE